MQQLLNEILDKVRSLIGRGKVADYIPALADVGPDQLGIAVYGRDGELSHAGNTLRPFSIQSISKVFSLVQAIQHSGGDIWQRLDHEPSGQLFNSLVQLEFRRGKPCNPFINAGALVICDINQSRFAASARSIRDFVRRPCNSPEVVSGSVAARSEYQHRSHNAATTYLMKSLSNFHNDIEVVLLSYFHRCALRMSCVDLARTFYSLAGKGFCKHSGGQVLDERQTKQVNAIMVISGLYDKAGSFAYRAGLPSRSGVGGDITTVVPRRFTVCVWSPELNAAGNSLAGTATLKEFSKRIGWSIF